MLTFFTVVDDGISFFHVRPDPTHSVALQR